MIIYDKKYNKNSHCRISLLLPEITFRKDLCNIYGNNVSTKKISFPTFFLLTTNSIYINISISVLGFGLRVQVVE